MIAKAPMRALPALRADLPAEDLSPPPIFKLLNTPEYGAAASTLHRQRCTVWWMYHTEHDDPV